VAISGPNLGCILGATATEQAGKLAAIPQGETNLH